MQEAGSFDIIGNRPFSSSDRIPQKSDFFPVSNCFTGGESTNKSKFLFLLFILMNFLWKNSLEVDIFQIRNVPIFLIRMKLHQINSWFSIDFLGTAWYNYYVSKIGFYFFPVYIPWMGNRTYKMPTKEEKATSNGKN